jgi:hypothetical protein
LLFFFRRHDSTGPTDTTGAARKIFTPRHGGCGFHRERESFGTVSSRGLFVVVLAGLSLVPATTFGEPSIRVRGAARFEAGATSEGDLVVVAGALLDDIGRGVGGGSIAVGALSADGQEVRALARPCPGEPALVPHGQAKAGELSIKPGRDGRFCLVLATAGIASVVLRYADERGLIDPSTRRLGVEATRRSLALRFVDAPAVLELERDTQRLDVLARSDGPLLTPLPPVPLALFARAARADAHDVLVAEGATELGRPVSLTFPSDKLDEPGPVDLTLRFSGSDRLQPAETHLRLHATARVSLALSRTPTAGDPREGIEIDVALATPKGAVESGAVEAVLGGRTIGIANVERGSARVTVRFPRSGPMTRVELRYLPREPWWRSHRAVPGAVWVGCSCSGASRSSWFRAGAVPGRRPERRIRHARGKGPWHPSWSFRRTKASGPGADRCTTPMARAPSPAPTSRSWSPGRNDASSRGRGRTRRGRSSSFPRLTRPGCFSPRMRRFIASSCPPSPRLGSYELRSSPGGGTSSGA